MRVATWNVGNRGDASVLHGLTHLAREADVLCLQECGDRKNVLGEFCGRQGWMIWLGEGPGASSVPILWNPKVVTARVKGTNPATKPTNAGKRGAGPNVVKAKVWQRVRFTEGKRAVVVINGHLPASLYLPGRRRLGKRMIAVLADMVRQRKGKVSVIAVGDFNSKPSSSLLNPLRKLGMTQRTHAPTHGRRTIDLVWTLGVGGVVEVIGMPSDHRAVVLSVKG